MKNKKKDHIIWDEAKEEYIAKLIPYASRVSGPLIEVPNVDAFKKKGIEKVSKQLNAELVDLKKKIKTFVKEASNTQKVYSAKFKFEPVVGEIYFYTKVIRETIYLLYLQKTGLKNLLVPLD